MRSSGRRRGGRSFVIVMLVCCLSILLLVDIRLSFSAMHAASFEYILTPLIPPLRNKIMVTLKVSTDLRGDD